MIPVGYMAKKIAQRPDYLRASEVKDIFSVSNCISHDFMDYIKFWRHNGYWFFDHPKIIQELSQENNIYIKNCTFFSYEVYEQEFDQESKQWLPFERSDIPTHVIPSVNKKFHGYDAVTFSMGTNPECSPLSCNHLASELRINAHCLMDSFEEVKSSLELGKFDQSEPGPFRIFAVYTIDPESLPDSKKRN